MRDFCNRSIAKSELNAFERKTHPDLVIELDVECVWKQELGFEWIYRCTNTQNAQNIKILFSSYFFSTLIIYRIEISSWTNGDEE